MAQSQSTGDVETTQGTIQAEDENKVVNGRTVETDAICAFD
jgi:hypothetical protein